MTIKELEQMKINHLYVLETVNAIEICEVQSVQFNTFEEVNEINLCTVSVKKEIFNPSGLSLVGIEWSIYDSNIEEVKIIEHLGPKEQHPEYFL